MVRTACELHSTSDLDARPFIPADPAPRGPGLVACRSKQSLDTPPAPSYLPYITAAIGDWLLPRCPPGYTSSSTIGTMDPLSLNVKEEFEGDDNASDDTLVDICASQEVGPCSSIASRSIPQVLLYATTCDDIYENPDREGAPAKASHSVRC